MVMVGIDAHKETFTAVAVDEVGRRVAERTFESTSDGCYELVRWASRWPERRFAVEDCRHLTRRLESDLLTAGETLVRVYPRQMAGERRGDRERGKSDPIDALAVARVALREPDLPVARLDGPARELRLLTGHRESLVRERTRLQNRLRWHLHELDPILVRVYPRLMAGERRGDRERGKSDPIDALAVARVALREPDLPVARLDGPARELRLLTGHRESLVRERTRLQNRLRWHLHELDPEAHIL